MQTPNKQRIHRWNLGSVVPATRVLLVASSLIGPGLAAGWAQEPKENKQREAGKSSYDQVTPVLLGQETLQARMDKDKADKPSVMARQKELLEARYDLTSRPDEKVKMSRGKPIQVGPATRLP